MRRGDIYRVARALVLQFIAGYECPLATHLEVFTRP